MKANLYSLFLALLSTNQVQDLGSEERLRDASFHCKGLEDRLRSATLVFKGSGSFCLLKSVR